jgi:hypothetical protein
MTPTKRVFLCYRHHDAGFAAGRIADYLTAQLGEDAVFRYVDTAGVTFEDITRTLLAADVVLLIMGDRWLSDTADQGQRRLDDPNDFLRLELEYAFARHLPVIPVLIEPAELPFAKDLPDPIKPLSRIVPARVSDRHFAEDAARLVELVANAKPVAPQPPGPEDKVTADDLVLVWTSWRAPRHDHMNPDGLPVYRFDVVIGAEPPVLDRIEKVIYFLPPAWGSWSPALVTDRPSAFRLKQITWSDLIVRARVYIQGQAEVQSLSSHIWRMEAGSRI